MQPCQQGYPCVYRRVASSEMLTCHFPACVMQESDESEELFVRDTLTGDVKPWVTVALPETREEARKRETRQEYVDYERMMADKDTYESRKGRTRARRVAKEH